MARKGTIVKDAIRRFYHLPNRTIARHILATHGDLFENNLEKIRNAVRYHTGKIGVWHKKSIPDKSLFRDTPVKLPQTWRKERTSYKLDVGLWLVLSDIHIPFHEPKPCWHDGAVRGDRNRRSGARRADRADRPSRCFRDRSRVVQRGRSGRHPRRGLTRTRRLLGGLWRSWSLSSGETSQLWCVPISFRGWNATNALPVSDLIGPSQGSFGSCSTHPVS